MTPKPLDPAELEDILRAVHSLRTSIDTLSDHAEDWLARADDHRDICLRITDKVRGALHGDADIPPNTLDDELSEERLTGVNTILADLMREAIATWPGPGWVRITEGVRTHERQEMLVLNGASWTRNSRHLTGDAVDVAIIIDNVARWEFPLYEKFAAHVDTCAMRHKVAITWGGDWKSKDGPHFELDRKVYPDET